MRLPETAQIDWLLASAQKVRFRDHAVATRYLKYAESLAEADTSQTLLAEVRNKLANVLVVAGLFEETIETVFTGLPLARRLKDQKLEIYFTYWLCGAYNELGEHQRSIAAAKETLDRTASVRDGYLRAQIINVYGEALRHAGDYLKAAAVYDEAFEVLRSNSGERAQRFKCVLFSNKAFAVLAAGDVAMTRSLLDSAGSCGFDAGHPLMIEAAMCEVQLLETMGKMDSAITLALEKVDLAKQRSMPRYQLQFMEWLIQTYRNAGDYGTALQLLERFHAVENTVRDRQVMARVRFQESEAEKRALREKAIRLEAERGTRKVVMLVLGGFLVSFLGFLWLIRRQNRMLRKLNLALQEKNQRLDDANVEIRGLISVLAGDLLKPLFRVRGMAGAIRKDAAIMPENIPYLDMIGQIVQGGTQLIQDVLSLSATRQGRDRELDVLDVAALVRLSVRGFQEQADQKGIPLLVEVPERLQLRSEATSFSRVLDNLVSNAIKFSPPGKRVWVSLAAAEGKVRLSVKDEGPGISEADQQKLFKKFQKLSARPTGGESSTGLGLSIVKSLVEELGGEIGVESELGVGTEFWVLFPDQT